jgi:ABC-type sugar transport system substrate-binding protein
MMYAEKGIEAAMDELRDYNVTGVMETVRTAEQADEVWKHFYEMGVSGIVACFNQYNSGISALMKEMTGFNIPVVSIITAPLDDTPYIGEVVSSGRVLGRMAGQLMGMILKPQAPVACFLPDMAANIHAQCAQTFSEESKAKGLDYKGIFYTGYDNDEGKTYQVTENLLDSCPDIGGIYVASSNACDVCKCVEDRGLSGKIVIIGHDLYPELAQCLKRGTLTATLFQNQYANAYKGVMTLFEGMY